MRPPLMRPPLMRPPLMRPPAIDHCVIAVSDLARSNAFYRDVLGAELVDRGHGNWSYRFGSAQLNVHAPGGDPRPVARIPVTPGNSDLCFQWPGPIEEAVTHLGAHGVAIEDAPAPRNGARGLGTSVYFRDPDGSLLEFISYVPSAPPAAGRRGADGGDEMRVTLRPQRPADLALLIGGDSPFDDFGPRPPQTEPRPSGLDDAGSLAVIAGDGEVAGDVGWHWRQWGPGPGSRCPMIGIWLRPDHRGQGIGRAAQAQLADLFFRHTTTNRVEAHTDVGNVAEQRALEAAGFQREGLIRAAQWRDGGYRDGFLYAIVRTDPRDGGVSSNR